MGLKVLDKVTIALETGNFARAIQHVEVLHKALLQIGEDFSPEEKTELQQVFAQYGYAF